MGTTPWSVITAKFSSSFAMFAIAAQTLANTWNSKKARIHCISSTALQLTGMEHNYKQKFSSQRVHEANQKPSHLTAVICPSSTVDARQSIYTYTTRLPTASIHACALSRNLRRHFELRKQRGVGGRHKFQRRGWVLGEVNYHTLARNSALRNMTTSHESSHSQTHLSVIGFQQTNN